MCRRRWRWPGSTRQKMNRYCTVDSHYRGEELMYSWYHLGPEFWRSGAVKLENGWVNGKGVEDEMSQLLQLQKPRLRPPLNRESHSER